MSKKEEADRILLRDGVFHPLQGRRRGSGVEQRTRNAQVNSSNLFAGSRNIKGSGDYLLNPFPFLIASPAAGEQSPVLAKNISYRA